MQEIERDEANARWVLKIEGEVASALMYNDNGKTISMTSTFTNPSFRGQGLASQVVEAAVADAEQRGRKVVPACWYVAQWFEKHPEQAHLLA